MFISVFEIFTSWMKLVIAALDPLQCENKNSSNEILSPLGIKLGPLTFVFNDVPSELTWHLLVSLRL